MNTHKYQARDLATQQIITELFPSQEEAEQYSNDHIADHTDQTITSLFAIATGIISDEEDAIDEDYNEDDELDNMGLKDEETEAGHDWNPED